MNPPHRRISRNRRIFWTVGLVLSAWLSWWVQIADPLSDRLKEQKETIAKLRQENERLSQRIERFAAYEEVSSELIETFRAKKQQVIPGSKLEEVNPSIQSAVQEIAEKTGISIKSYKDLPAGQWKGHAVARIEVQSETTTENLAKFLEAVEATQKLIRLERLVVSYRKVKGFELSVTMQIGALYLEEKGD